MATPVGSIWLFTGAAAVAAVTVGALAWEAGAFGTAVPKVAPSPVALATPAASAAAPAPPAASPAPLAPAPTVAAALPAPSPAAAKVAEAAPEKPAFDVVRIEPGGDTVVAGHGAPKAKIDLRVDGAVVDSEVADDSGQVVFVPPPLAPGPHALALATSANGGPIIVSASSNVVVDPKAPPSPKPSLVAVAAPATKATLAESAPAAKPSSTVAPAAPKASPVAAAPVPSPTLTLAALAPTPAPAASAAQPAQAEVFVRAVAASAEGRLEVQGSAAPGRTVRIYLNGSYLADAVAGSDGQWSLTIAHGMTAGDYSVRADIVDASGAVLARSEVPYAYPRSFPTPRQSVAAAPTMAASPSPEAIVAAAPTPTPSVIAIASPTPQPAAPEPAATSPAAGIAAPSPAPTQAAAAEVPTPAPSPAEVTPPPSPANVVVEDVRTTTVVRGDTLWDFGRRFYGDGLQYHQIYAANTNQIRDPHWIYPGQIFVVPGTK